MSAVAGFENQKFPIDGIAERETPGRREASNGIEEESVFGLRVLSGPRFAGVRGFEDGGLVAFAAGHKVGGLVIKSDDAAEVEVRCAGSGEMHPSAAAIAGKEDGSV